MLFPKYVYIILLNLFSTVLSWKHASETQFQSIIQGNDLVLVAFVAPWTEPSKALESEWLLATKQSEEKLISIDCTKEVDLCKKYKVISYPTIRLFKKDKVTRYRGPRKASSIIPFLQRSKLPVLSIVDNTNITTFPNLDSAGTFIACLPSSSPSRSHLLNIFTTLAQTHHTRYTFGISTSASLASSLGFSAPGIIYHNPYTSTQEVFSGNPTLPEVEKFLTAATTPVIGEFTRKNEITYLKSGKSLVYLFHHTAVQQEHFLETLGPLAAKYKEYLNFVTVDAKEYGHMLGAVGLSSEGQREALALFNPMFGKKYPFGGRGGITEENVEAFVLDIVQGKIESWDGSSNSRTVTHDEM